MVHKWLEECYDLLMLLGILTGMLLFFCVYWNEEYQIRYAEIVLDEFLTEVTASGKITLEEYETMVCNLNKVNPKYNVDITYIEKIWQPVYSVISEEILQKYYIKRNVKQEREQQELEIVVEEEREDTLQLQTESNATILAAGQAWYLPLPEEGIIESINAVVPFQEVYEGENLITVCYVESPSGYYYAIAEPIAVNTSGTVMLQLWLQDDIYEVPVEVLCHPRTVMCKNGHEIVNSKKLLSASRENGDIICPYCAAFPEYVRCNTAVIQKKTGQKLSKEEIWIDVMYLDGHRETIAPDSDEWQDTYDENYCGMQQVTITYRGKKDTVIVIAENENCRNCNRACNDRCYEDYKMFPYCTQCMANIALFTGETLEEEQWTRTNEIVSFLDKKQEFLLQTGNFVVLSLYKGEKTVSWLQKKVRKDGR